MEKSVFHYYKQKVSADVVFTKLEADGIMKSSLFYEILAVLCVFTLVISYTVCIN